MPNPENLKPCRTPEEAKERGRKGGIASGKVRQERKQLRDLLISELEKEASKDGMSKEEFLVAKCLQNYSKGKLTFKDLKDLQDLLGESVTNLNVKSEGLKIEVSQEVADMMARDHGYENNEGI